VNRERRTNPDWAVGGQIHNAPDSPESKLGGGPIQDNPDKARRVNPVTYVDKSAPPFLIVHGTLDRLVPFNQSQILAVALEASGTWAVGSNGTVMEKFR